MKNSIVTNFIFVSLPFILVGCADTFPLVFVDKTTVGISASAHAEGSEIVLGFKTTSLAMVPVAVKQEDANGNKDNIIPLQATSKDQGVSSDGNKPGTESLKLDAYSTFGNFTVDTETNPPDTSIGLGRFFATGVAAQNIAEKLGDAWIEKIKNEGKKNTAVDKGNNK